MRRIRIAKRKVRRDRPLLDCLNPHASPGGVR
jgi:hypothetical protein